MNVTETSFTVSDLARGHRRRYLRVRGSGGTGDQVRLMSGWSSLRCAGMSATPIAIPPAPTGLNATGGDGSITWEWNAVDGAMGYQVQVSATEDFSDADTVDLDADTTSHSVDVDAGSTRYLRVRATGMGDPSAWSTHVTGTSDAAPVPPPAPVSAKFTLPEEPDSPHYMVADNDDDEDTAMAWVNPEIMVESNSDAIIRPMFLDGAAGVSVAEGNNMPFTYVGAEGNWDMKQSDVLDTGATFKIVRGDGENPGDVAYVTCGPFECIDGMDPPVPSIANSGVCTDWNPTVEIQVGKIDNDVVPPLDNSTDVLAYATGVDTNDGVDLGIVTSSSLAMNVTHVFSGVANGTNTSRTVEAAGGSNRTLAMTAVASIHVDQDADVPGGTGTPPAPLGVNEEAVCEDSLAGTGRYDAGSINDKPDGCFRLRGPGADRTDNNPARGANYLSGWSIELTPVGGDVAWGRVEWEDDPFEDLTCPDSAPMMVTELMADSGQDICEDLFNAEVNLRTARGWHPTVVFGSETADFGQPNVTTTADEVIMWRASARRASSGTQRFKTIWFDDNLDGTILGDREDRPLVDDGTSTNTFVQASDFNDLWDDNGDPLNLEVIWQFLYDADGDLTSGDLGLVDLVSSRDDRSTEDDERTIFVEACGPGFRYDPDDGPGTTLDGAPCKGAGGATAGRTQSPTATATHPDGNADNYESLDPSATVTHGTFGEVTTSGANNLNNRTVMAGADDFYRCSEDDGGDDDDGSICDAEWVNPVTITFADGTFGCSTARDVTVTCTWDADGGMAQGRNALPSEFSASGADENKDFFLSCVAE